MNTGGPAFPIHGSGMFHEPITKTQGMTLLDWMAGQALAAMVEAESKESHKQLTNDGYEHEATHFPRGFADEDYWDGAAKASYACAAAMLAEKARREADHSEDKLGKDHSHDAEKVAEINWEFVEALESCEAAFSKFAPQEESAYGMAWIKVRATLAKAKGVA